MTYVWRGKDRDALATADRPRAATSNMKAAIVPVDRIQFHNHNVRRDLGDLRELADSIRRHGVVTPIVLERRGETFRIRDGHRRVAAAQIAGLSRIPAFVHGEALDVFQIVVVEVVVQVLFVEQAGTVLVVAVAEVAVEGAAATAG